MQKYLTILKKITSMFKRDAEDDRSFMEKLRDHYRLVLMNEETFEEVGSFQLSPLNAYIFFSSLIVGTAILVTLLIIYTPLKRYIPGYGDVNRTREVAELSAKVRRLENEMEATRVYSENFRKILTNDVATLTKEADDAHANTPLPQQKDSNAAFVNRIPEDDALREAISKGKIIPIESSAPGGDGSAMDVANSHKEVSLERIYFIPPVQGETTKGFDAANDHFGIDIASSKNTAVKACANGVVISAGFAVETGNSIAIQHDNNVISFYKHNSALLKKAGARVKAGEAIAIIGNSGEQSTGPHLHFELWYRGRAVNPIDYINFN